MPDGQGQYSFDDFEPVQQPAAGQGQYHFDDFEPVAEERSFANVQVPPALKRPPIEMGGVTTKRGLLEPGNIDLAAQPRVKNPDGSISTVRSMSFEENGQEILVPTVVGNQVVSDQDAITAYRKTGRHLGKFDSPEAATAYAQKLHEDYAAGKYDQPPPAPRLRTVTQGGEPVYGPPVPIGAVPVLDAPAVGSAQIGRGVRSLFTPPPLASHPLGTPAPPPEPHEPTEQEIAAQVESGATPLSPYHRNAISDVIEGAFKVLTPVAAGAGLGAPVSTGLTLLSTTVAGKAAREAFKAIGADESAQRLAENLAAAAAGTGVAADQVYRAIDSAKAAARPLILAGQLHGAGYGPGEVPGFKTGAFGEGRGIPDKPVAVETVGRRRGKGQTPPEVEAPPEATAPAEPPIPETTEIAAPEAPPTGQGALKMDDFVPAPTAVKEPTPQVEPEWKAGLPEFVTAPYARPGEASPESRYAGDKLSDLLPQVEEEQRGRHDAIQALEGRLAAFSEKAKQGPNGQRLQRELDALRTEYDGTYSEVMDAAGEAEATALRGRVESAEQAGETPSAPSAEQAQGQATSGVLTPNEPETAPIRQENAPKSVPSAVTQVSRFSTKGERSDWTEIGRNAIGQTLYEDQRGVRSYLENGTRHTEAVQLRPTRAGMEYAVDRTSDLNQKTYVVAVPLTAQPEERKTEEEPRATEPAAPSPPASQPQPERVGGVRAPRPSGQPGAGARPQAGFEPRPSPGTREPGTVPEREPTERPVGTRPNTVARDPSVAPDLYHITDADQIGTGSVKERVSRNLAAIRVIRLLEEEKRLATPDEKAMLVKYVGWGGLSRIFEPWKNEEGEEKGEYWAEQLQLLRGVMTEDELANARNSTQNAHYTSPLVIRAMWDAVRHLGVAKGSALEPSAGIGHFIGLVPNGLKGLTWATTEKDAITAAITNALYPGAFNQHTPFEDAKLPKDHFTLAISNVPFGLIPITDQNFEPDFIKRRIHNYFFGKALDYVAPGGLIAFVTSRGTLDSSDETGVRSRRYLAARADFLGAIRMPFTAFKGNAGTEVIADIIFLRKRKDGDEPQHVAPWIDSQKVQLPNKAGEPIDQHMNEYMLAHPEMVLGTSNSTGKMRGGPNGYNVAPTGDLGAQLAEAIARLPSGVIDTTPPKKDLAAFTQKMAPEGSRPFEYMLHEGRIGQVNVAGVVETVKLTSEEEARIKGLLPIRKALRSVYDIMARDGENAELEAAQAALTKTYDAFTKKFGTINTEKNWRAFYEDPDLPLLLSLEDYDEERDVTTKAAVFTTRTKRAERRATKASSPQHALTIALSETGAIDFDRIADLLTQTTDEAQAALLREQLVVDTPAGWQLPAIYLSGNVRVKLEEAEAAAQLDSKYALAVTLLKAVQPEPVPAHKIAVRLGVSWVPPAMVQDFIESFAPSSSLKVGYSAPDATWTLDGSSPASPYETTDADTKTILLDALNDRRRVIKTVQRTEEGTITSTNKQATALVRQKRDDVNRAFGKWLLADDPDRRTWALTTYNDRFNAYVEPKIDGSYLTLPGMADYWRDHIADHQRDAIARIVQLGNTLLAHVVGAGKTLAMVGGMMELKRAGLARKPMMVVPNHLIAQAPGQFIQYYPNAKLLVVTTEDLEASHRKRITARIAAGDWDAVIVPYSVFVRIPMSVEAEAAYQREILDQIELAILQAWAVESAATSSKGNRSRGGSGKTPPSVKRLENTRDRIQKRLDQLAARPKDDLLTFEQLGVDALFVDEAHSFKNLYFPTRQQAAGIPQDSDAQRATDLYLKARYINDVTHNRGLVLATGTPVSNSMAEIYVMQRLLQESDLKRAGLVAFDAWLTQFGTITTETEFDPSGTGMTPRARLKKFRNLPVLAAMFRQVADVKMIDDLPELKKRRPKLRTGDVEAIKIEMSGQQEALLAELLERSENMDPRNKKADNMPMVTTDGRLGFTDMRLLDRRTSETPNNKIARVAKETLAIYKEHDYHKGTQLIFLDSGPPGSEIPAKFKWDTDAEGNKIKRPLTDKELHRGFDLYTDLKRKLVKGGMPANQIAFIHDIDKASPKQREEVRRTLFRKMRRGEIRVLIGSTGKMGTGMNVQDRLVALHHVDPAWKPSDIEQRSGRILRQGNIFFKEDPDFEVRILAYLTSGKGQAFGFDAYMWNLNQQKAETIRDFFSGDLAGMANEQSDLDLAQTVATAAGLKAIATGNPAIVELNKAEGEYERLRNVHLGWEDNRREAELHIDWAEASALIEDRQEARAKATAAAITPYEEGTTLTSTINGHEIEGFKDLGEALIEQAKEHSTLKAGVPTVGQYDRPEVIGTIRGLTATIERQGTDNASPHLVLRHPDAERPRYAGHVEEDTEYASIHNSLMRPDPDSPGGVGWRNPTGLVTELMNRVKSVLQFSKGTHAHQAAGRYRAILSAPFEQQAELDAARAKVEEIRALLGQTPDTIEQTQQEEIGGSEDEEGPRGGSTGGGISLQSTILPGAKELGEYVIEPAVKALAEQVKRNSQDMRELFAPAGVSSHAERAAGSARANLAARNQRIQRAQRTFRDVEKMMAGWSHDQSMMFWDVMEGQLPIEELSPAIATIARTYRHILDAKRAQVLKRGLLKNYLEHYWGHEWVRGTAGAQALLYRLFGKRPLAGPESYRKHRTIPTMREGIEDAGLEPLSWNPTTQLLRKLTEMDRSIAAHDIVRELKAMKEIKFVAAGRKVPDGWKRLPDAVKGPVFGPPVMKTATGEEARIPFGKLLAGHYYGPPEVVRILENMTSKGLMGRSALFDLYRTMGNFMVQAKLSFSAFHAVLTSMQAVVTKQALAFELLARGEPVEALKKQLEVPIAPILSLLRGHRALKAFYAVDANARVVDGIIGQVIQAGGGFGWSLFEHSGAPKAFMEALRSTWGGATRGEIGTVAGGLSKAARKAIPALVEAQAMPIMNGLVPRLKMAAFLEMAEMEMRSLGPAPDLQEARRVLGQVWDSIDNRFGQLRYDNLFWHNALKDLGLASVQALGWNVGSIREMFGVVPAQAKQLGIGGGGGFGKPPTRNVNVGEGPEGPKYERVPESRLHRKLAWLIAEVLVYGLAGAILTYLMTGERPHEVRDYFFPKTKDGRRVSLPGYIKDYFHVFSAPIETLRGKIHPLLVLLADTFENEDFYGVEIRNPNDPLVQQALEWMQHVVGEFKPIPLQVYQRQGTAAAVRGTLGLPPAPAAVSRSPVESYLHSLIPPQHHTQEDAAKAKARRDVKGLMEAGDHKEAQHTASQLGLTDRQVKNLEKQVSQGRLVASFQHTTADQALRAYRLATPTERRALKPYLMEKLDKAMAKIRNADEFKNINGRYREALHLDVAGATH